MATKYRACRRSYSVFSLICFVPALPAILGSLFADKGVLWEPMLIGAVVWLFSIFWLSRFSLEFDADSVSYASLFSSRRTVQRSRIMVAAFAESTGLAGSLYTFVIRDNAGTEIRVNAKVFSLEAVRELINLSEDIPKGSL